MIIVKISENPFRKHKVKNLPNDAKYNSQSVDGNEVYFSKTKSAYYEIKK